jgi:hypothetical protein
VPACHPGDIIPYDPQHVNMDGPHHRLVDVHSENSVRKINILVKVPNINIHENPSVWNFITPHVKRKNVLFSFNYCK